MITNANAIQRGSNLSFDICIVGGGAAGISMAVDLIGKDVKVLLLESGGLKYNELTQSLYDGEVVDQRLHSPANKYRHRRFGGSTAIWGGRCMPFDEIDFEERSFLPLSGWPIRYSDLLPYYQAANRLADAGQFEYDAEAAAGPNALPLAKNFKSDVVRTDGIERFSLPTHFGIRYRQQLEEAPNVTVILGANCQGIELSESASTVKHVKIKSLQGNNFLVEAKKFVLALGGLETPRLMLASDSVARAGVGNHNDVVGRYYMCHIAGNVGELSLSAKKNDVFHGYMKSVDGVYCRRRLSLTAAKQREIQALNMVARLHFPRITDPSHGSGVLSGLYFSRRFISYEYSKRLSSTNEMSFSTTMRHLFNVIKGPYETGKFLHHWLTYRTFAQRKFPSVILDNRSNRFSLEIHAEQSPNIESRVSLSGEVDLLGMPRIKIDWQYLPSDIESVRKTLDVFSAEFDRCGAGTFRYNGDELEQDLTRFGAYGGHHIGTARMGTDPKTSVVDANCRVHGIDNLYIAGSAVFPTSSQANPTLTAIALSLRLSSHLSKAS